MQIQIVIAKLRAAILRAAHLIRRLIGLERRLQPPNFDGEMVMTVYGVWMKPRPMDATYRWSVRGSYGFFISDFISSISEDFRFIDIGANQGLFSLIAARNKNCREVIAFEPNPVIFPYLKSNVDAQVIATAELINAAIGSGASTKRLHFDERHSGAGSFLSNIEARKSTPVTTLGPREIRALLAPSSNLNVIKIDVEGAELEVLDCLSEAGVLSEPTLICIEQNLRFHKNGEIEQRLAEAGFQKVDCSLDWGQTDCIYRN